MATKDELLAVAKELGVEVDKTATKADIEAAIKSAGGANADPANVLTTTQAQVPAQEEVAQEQGDNVSTENFHIGKFTNRLGIDVISIRPRNWVGEPPLTVSPDQVGELSKALAKFAK